MFPPAPSVTTIAAGLLVLVVLLGPILFEPIERNLEIFFLVVGAVTALVTGQFGRPLLMSALTEPVELTAAVLVFGAIFRELRPYIDRWFARAIAAVDPRWLCGGLTIVLGLMAGFITVVVAALVFVEAVSMLRLDRRSEILSTVLGCFAIGLGGGLTPLGMPASTLVLAALHADFWYLARLAGPFIGAGILLIAIAALFVRSAGGTTHPIRERESWALVLIRAGKIYVFIAGLVALSRGLRPVVDAYVVRVPDLALFWINTLSAVVDNATLAAIEIGPGLSLHQQRAALLSLLVSGGILIPGNIPNIVAATRLKIRSREWARAGVPIGLALLIICFAVLTLVPAFR